MNTQLRQCFGRAKPFRLKKAKFCLSFLFPKKPMVFQILALKSQIGCNPDQQFSLFIFAEAYAGLLYYVIIRFLCRA